MAIASVATAVLSSGEPYNWRGTQIEVMHAMSHGSFTHLMNLNSATSLGLALPMFHAVGSVPSPHDVSV